MGMPVRKHGRTTGLTTGTIDDIAYDAIVGMDHNDSSVVALFVDQLRIVPDSVRPIALGGDSGSLFVHRNESKAVGLFFACPPSGSYGLANPIDEVLSRMRISIA